MTGLRPKPEKSKNMSDRRVEDHVNTRGSLEKAVKEKAHDALRQLKININQMTLGARSKGGDIPSLRQKRFEDMVEQKIGKQQEALLKKLDDMFATYDGKEDYSKFLERVKSVVDNGVKDINRLVQAITYAVKCLAGYNGEIEVADYAYFYTLLDNISILYGKNVKIGEIFVHIQNDNLAGKDWDIICDNIKSNSLRKVVAMSADSLKLSTGAFLVQLMNPHQRTQMLLEFNKRYGKKQAIKLADQMVQTNAISLKQHEFVMGKINGMKYTRTQVQENLIRKKRRQAEMLTHNIDKNLYRSLAINGAERIFNRKSMGSLLLTGIGAVGMITNYMAGLNTGKGIGKYFKGLKNPYFLFSMGVAGYGTHLLTGSMHPGKSVGLFNELIPKPKQLENPFGVSDIASKQDYQMKILANICANHKVVENWLLYGNGFDDLHGFYAKKQFDRKKIKSKMLTTQQRTNMKNGKKKGLYDEFLEYVEKEAGNKKGAVALKEAKRLYGKGYVERLIFNLTVSSHTLGILTTADFKRKSTPENIKYYDVFLYRQGVKPRPVAMRKKTKSKTKK